MFPPLNHILGAHFCSQRFCTVLNRLMGIDFTAALGTLQIMVGLFNIGLGPGRTSTHPEDLTDLGAAYWLGAVFITSGIVSLVFNRCCWLSAIVNIVAAIVSIVGIVLYVTDLNGPPVYSMCNQTSSAVDVYDHDCFLVAQFAQKLLRDLDIALAVMSALQLWASSSVALSHIVASGAWEEGAVGEKEFMKEVVSSPGA